MLKKGKISPKSIFSKNQRMLQLYYNYITKHRYKQKTKENKRKNKIIKNKPKKYKYLVIVEKKYLI